MQLDLRIDNAQVRTMDRARPAAHSIGVLHGRIVGLDDEIASVSAARIVDLCGRTVLPGFVDAHNHLAWTGLAATSLDLSGVGSVDEVLALIGAAARQVTVDGWIDAVGYDQRPLGRHLTAADLDAVTAGRRFYGVHTSGHAHLVNTAVLDLLPDDFDASADEGIVRDADGRPTGVFLEEATRFVNALRTPYAVDELVDALEVAARICAAEGVTSVTEAGIGGGLTSRSPVELLAYQRAVESGRFTLRAQVMISLDALVTTRAHPADAISHAFATGLRTGFGSDRLSIGATKTWLDGGMMARTAALTTPYLEDGAAGSGALASELDGIREHAIASHAAGWQLALHAIGDAAVDAALDIIAAAQREHPRDGARHRIEHCGLTRPDQLARLAALGVVAVTQPTFLHAFGDDYSLIMGETRAPWLYRGQSYLDEGIVVAGSSDRPVADGAPLRGIQFLVERTSRTGLPIGPDEAMSLDDAVHAYTMGSAYACRLDDRVGSITVGKLADLVVLDADPWQVAPSQLSGIQIVTTVVGGDVVHGDWPDD